MEGTSGAGSSEGGTGAGAAGSTESSRVPADGLVAGAGATGSVATSSGTTGSGTSGSGNMSLTLKHYNFDLAAGGGTFPAGGVPADEESSAKAKSAPIKEGAANLFTTSPALLGHPGDHPAPESLL